MDEADLDRSIEIIRNYIESPAGEPVPDLTCPKCGEKGPGTFAVCWNCGTVIAEGPDKLKISIE